MLTDEEKKMKKGWLILLMATVLLNASVFFGLLGNMPEVPFVFRLFGFGCGVAFAFLYYFLCYRKTTTFLLTLSLVSFWFTLLLNGILLFKGSLPFDLLLGISLALGSAQYLFTYRLRALNKALKEVAKFPEESKEALSSLQGATSLTELETLFSDSLKKWPRLKWVLKRERKLKTNGSCLR